MIWVWTMESRGQGWREIFFLCANCGSLVPWSARKVKTETHWFRSIDKCHAVKNYLELQVSFSFCNTRDIFCSRISDLDIRSKYSSDTLQAACVIAMLIGYRLILHSEYLSLPLHLPSPLPIICSKCLISRSRISNFKEIPITKRQ